VVNLVRKFVYVSLAWYNEFLEKMQENTFYAPTHANWCATNFAAYAECDCGGGSSPDRRTAENRR